jgi:hypothetical protein
MAKIALTCTAVLFPLLAMADYTITGPRPPKKSARDF